MVRGWLLVAVFLLAAELAGCAPHKEREGEEGGEHAKDTSYLHRAWIWIQHTASKVKGWAVGPHSLYNQLKDKMKGNRTISVLGKQVVFTLPDPSSSSSKEFHWGSSISEFMHNLKKEPVGRVFLALYINIVIFIAVYGYLIARHIMMSINLKKASQPEKERERRRAAERRKMVKKLAKESKRGGFRNPAMLTPPSGDVGNDDETMRSPDFFAEEEEAAMDSAQSPLREVAAQPEQPAEASVYATPNQTMTQ